MHDACHSTLISAPSMPCIEEIEQSTMVESVRNGTDMQPVPFQAGRDGVSFTGTQAFFFFDVKGSISFTP